VVLPLGLAAATALAPALALLPPTAGLPARAKRPHAMPMKRFDEHANGQAIRLSRGETFAVRLEENPSTGFRWQIVTDGAPTCVLAGDAYRAAGKAMPGRPGRHTWTFRAERAGQATIELVSRRTWESHAPPAKVFRLTVTVSQ
jgi:inhibitor of cysteine peptidase